MPCLLERVDVGVAEGHGQFPRDGVTAHGMKKNLNYATG
jgi:hypothetical protein